MPNGLSKYIQKKIPAVANFRSTILEQRDSINRLENALSDQRSEISDIKSLLRSLTASSQEPAISSESYKIVKQMLQQAAVRNLPFLPFDISFTNGSISIEAWASAPNGLYDPVRFYANGRALSPESYPVRDAGLLERLDEVQGASSVKATGDVSADPEHPFIRLDQASNGTYNEHDWRRAIHVMHPKFEKFPFPPDANKLRVIGDTHETRFKMGGAIVFKNVEAYLKELGHTWSDFASILDWGCGAGRVTRYLIGESGQSITGADIDNDNIAWCRENLKGGRFETIPLMPRTEFRDGEFDLAIGVSVFTHLTEAAQFAWLQELQRIIRPGGYALMSIQGPTQFAYNRFPPEIYLRLQQEGFIDLSVDPALKDVVEDQEYYRSTMHSRNYISNRWSEFFDVIEIVDAIAALQDFVVLRRR